ncbi:MAG: glycosyltransferase family 4 protein [Bacteroidales bacterium]|nr:MAG: glycosyltransferase family 4 protein [Bacteroidales bacterium]
MTKVYISVTNDIITDQRVNKIALSLGKLRAEIVIVGRKIDGKIKITPKPYKQKLFRLLFNKGPLFYAEYNIRLFFFLLFKKVDILVANDLDTLPANYLVSRIRKKKLVYDSHEYYTEVPELAGRDFVKKVWTKMEKRILPKVKYSYTVCDSIAQIYSENYNINMHVIRNFPPYIENLPETGVKISQADEKIIIYQGSLNLARGLEIAIQAMEFVDNAKLLIIGKGDITSELKKLANKAELHNKVIFFDRMPYEELMEYTVQADLGISLEENTGLNYYYALPNKLFDYIQARIPVLVSDFPEMAKVVNDYGVGLTINTSNPGELASVFKEMLENKDKRRLWKQNLEKAAKELCWEREEKKLLEIYSGII